MFTVSPRFRYLADISTFLDRDEINWIVLDYNQLYVKTTDGVLVSFYGEFMGWSDDKIKAFIDSHLKEVPPKATKTPYIPRCGMVVGSGIQDCEYRYAYPPTGEEAPTCTNDTGCIVQERSYAVKKAIGEV